MAHLAEWLLVAAGIYVGAGLVFALAFVTRGAQRIDPRAEGGSWGFRVAILPASVVLWPLLASRWVRGAAPREERTAHREIADRGERG